LTFSSVRIGHDDAPIPERIVDESGNVLFARYPILDGQEPFPTYGLMQFGARYVAATAWTARGTIMFHLSPTTLLLTQVGSSRLNAEI
jgi:nitric oxide reductase large subunit